MGANTDTPTKFASDILVDVSPFSSILDSSDANVQDVLESFDDWAVTIQADVDGFPGGLKDLTDDEITQLKNINATTISQTQWAYLGAMNQGVASGNSPTFAGLTLAGALGLGGNDISGVGQISASHIDMGGGNIDNVGNITNCSYSDIGEMTTTDIIMADDGSIGQPAGPLLTFDDTLNLLALSGGDFTFGTVEIYSDKIKLTALGGYAIKLTNKTGSATVQGQLVKSDTATDDGVILTAAGDQECIGVFLDSGIADDAEAWVVVAGIADVAMEDNTASTHGYWVKNSDSEAGYADATNAAPPGGGVAQLDDHMQEIGHCIESVAAGGAGTHILARCVLHFN